MTLSCGADYGIYKEVIEVVDPPPTHVVVDSLIQATLPEQLDVIMVLDGDDWFSNSSVLSRLDKEYSSCMDR